MKSGNNASARAELLQIFTDALDAVQGRKVVRQWLQEYEGFYTAPRVVALGKAACSMARGASDVLSGIEAGLIITKYEHADGPPCTQSNWQCIEAGHPYPDENSLAAGQALLNFIADSAKDTPFLFLISGGTSALVEVLPAGMQLEHLTQLNRDLLHRSLDIDQINAVRRSLSCIKGGRLAHYLGERRVEQLLISDVPNDAPHVIGSGLLVPAPVQATPRLGSPWEEFAGRVPAPPAGPTQVRTHIVANNQRAREAAAEAAHRLGWPVRLNQTMEGEVGAMSRTLAETLHDGEPGLYIWGGETHLQLPANPGQGGRCQSLALATAMQIADCPQCLVLAAGTDGSEGPTPDTGALVDHQSVARGQAAGLDAGAALEAADAGRFLAESGDLINTGPTGTNVMDLVLALKLPGDGAGH